jgi:NAD(P)-dependent dehydrogenase (short-subunit alcohol dehydrogenase family)
MSLQGISALITGATSEIGEAVATRFADEGADVVISGRNLARGMEFSSRLADVSRVRAKFVRADLATPSGPLELAQAAEDWLGGVDVLVNAAGAWAGLPGPSAALSGAALDAIFTVNLKAPFVLSTALMPLMANRGGGSIVNISSAIAERGYPGFAAYAASKAALEAVTRSWAAKFGRSGVRVNAVSPGVILTDKTIIAREELAGLCSLFGLRRYGIPEEVASAVAFLAGPQSRYVTGTTLRVDGGMLQTLELDGRSKRLFQCTRSARPAG